MTPFKDLSIKSKLTWVIMLTSCVALLMACAAFVAQELFTFRQSMVQDLSTLANVIGNNSRLALTFDMQGAQTALDSLSAEKQIFAAAVYKGGKIFAKYPKDRNDAAFPAKVEGENHQFEKNSLILVRPILDPDNRPLGAI